MGRPVRSDGRIAAAIAALGQNVIEGRRQRHPPVSSPRRSWIHYLYHDFMNYFTLSRAGPEEHLGSVYEAQTQVTGLSWPM